MKQNHSTCSARKAPRISQSKQNLACMYCNGWKMERIHHIGVHGERLTTKGSDTAKRMVERRAPLSLLMARTSSLKGGFCPDSSASELPAQHSDLLRQLSPGQGLTNAVMSQLWQSHLGCLAIQSH